MSSLTTSDQNTFTCGVDRVIERLQLVKATAPKPIRIFPGPSDFLEVGRFIKEVGEIFDDLVRACGDEVECNSPFHIDSRDFDHVATDGISSAAYCCESIADRLQDEREGV